MPFWRGTVLRITQGDVVTFNLRAVNADAPVNLTSAVFTTTIRGPGGVIRSFGNSQHTANPDQSNPLTRGKFTLALTALDTASIVARDGLEVLTKIVLPGSITIYFHGADILDVQSNEPAL